MNDLNQCNFIGRLGADPESKYLPNGDAVCSFRIAVGWKTKDKEGAEWVRISAFGKLAEICGQYLKKGSQVYVSGRLSTRKWTDKEGRDQYTTEIRADQMQMLGGKPEQSEHPCSKAAQPARPDHQQPGWAISFNDFDDDIPF